jgi:type I restriction enzyme, S subunit
VRGMSLHNEIRVVRSSEPITFNQDIKAVVAGPDLDARFLYYVLTAAKPKLLGWVSAAGHGTGVLATDRLLLLEVPDMPVAAQQAIASTVSDIDDKIKLNRRMNATLEAMAQGIFRDWFVDFGPVRRKLEGATDPVAILGGLIPNFARAAEIAALFPDALGDDGLPVGWMRASMTELIDFNPREALPKGHAAPYSDMASLPTQGCTAEQPVLREFTSGMKFRNGDALLARITPCLENGKAALVNFLPSGNPVGWGSTEFIVMRARPPIPSPFAYLLTRWPEFRATAIQSMTGTSGRQRARSDALGAFEFVKAPDPTYMAFDQLITPMFDKITQAGSENRTLAETRDYLLPRLMSGKVRVRDAERAMA